MEDLRYSALDLAAVMVSRRLDAEEQAEFLERVWRQERLYLRREYREDKRRLVLETFYWQSYLADQPAMDAEFPIVQRDAAAAGGVLRAEDYTGADAGLALFFKSVRLRCRCLGAGEVRIKRRTLLKRCGYRRLSPGLADFFRRCLEFYRLQVYVRGRIECRIEDAGMEDMLVFRLRQ